MSKIKVIVFDLGGTLFEYVGMPLSWAEYYDRGLNKINTTFHCQCSPDEIKKAADIMRGYNPRVNYHECEIAPTTIFTDAIGHWRNISDLKQTISVFWQGINLKVRIYDDSACVLQQLKNHGYQLAALTDIPTAMPDEMMKRDIARLLPYFDFYVSSQSCGYRKPNTNGLNVISSHFSVSSDEMIFIGDESKDKEAAEAFGCRFVKIDRSRTDTNAVHDIKEFINIVNCSDVYNNGKVVSTC